MKCATWVDLQKDFGNGGATGYSETELLSYCLGFRARRVRFWVLKPLGFSTSCYWPRQVLLDVTWHKYKQTKNRMPSGGGIQICYSTYSLWRLKALQDYCILPICFREPEAEVFSEAFPRWQGCQKAFFNLFKSFQGAAFIWARMGCNRWKYKSFCNYLLKNLFYYPSFSLKMLFSYWYSCLEHRLSSVLVFCLALPTDANA